MVTCQEHNYRATVGRDYDQLKKERARRVTWIDESDDTSSIEEGQEVSECPKSAKAYICYN